MTRFREFYDMTTTGGSRARWETTYNRTWDYDRQDLFTSGGRYNAMRDVVTPNFGKLRNQGQIINNPLWLEDISWSFKPLTVCVHGFYQAAPPNYIWWDYRVTRWFTEIYGENGSLLSGLLEADLLDEWLDDYTASSEELAVTRSWANVELSEAMILASLGEFPETLKWMHSVLKRGVNLTKMFSGRGLFKAGREIGNILSNKPARELTRLAKPSLKSSKQRDLVSDVANIWLEYRYAIRPLVFEMKQCLEALKTIIRKGTRQTARGKEVNVSSSTHYDTYTDTTASWYTQSYTCRRRESLTVSSRAGVLFEIDDSLDTLLAVWGVDQPLESLWELVPFSFIIDWFFSVGDVISSWSVNPSLNPRASWVTSFVHHAVELDTTLYQLGNKSPYFWETPEVTHGSARVLVKRKRRVPSPPRSITPSFDLKLDLSKIIDLGFIGRAILSGKKSQLPKKGA